jgi:hypothetical protein
MRCPDPDALCSLAGTRKVIELSRKLTRPGRYGDEGSGRVQNAWVAGPDRVRNFRPGQAAWIGGNACTYIHVSPWRRPPLALQPVQCESPIRREPAQLMPAQRAEPGLAGPELPLPEGATR